MKVGLRKGRQKMTVKGDCVYAHFQDGHVTCSRNETWCFYSENCGFFDKGKLGIERLRTDFIAARAERDAASAETDRIAFDYNVLAKREALAGSERDIAIGERDAAVQRAERLHEAVEELLSLLLDTWPQTGETRRIVKRAQATLRGEEGK
jgi:hypothetical protein